VFIVASGGSAETASPAPVVGLGVLGAGVGAGVLVGVGVGASAESGAGDGVGVDAAAGSEPVGDPSESAAAADSATRMRKVSCMRGASLPMVICLGH
jgi:hypothetical protein